MSKSVLSEDAKSDIKNVGISIFKAWLEENKIELKSKKNFFEALELGLDEGKITKEQITHALCELEENSDKKIRFFKIKNDLNKLPDLKNQFLKVLRLDHGWQSVKDYSVKVKAKEASTFNYMSWEGNTLKIKYSEKHYNVEADFEANQFERNPKIVYIIILINFEDGLVQIRYDNPGALHKHKNSKGKPSEAAYEKYYEDLLMNLFDELKYGDLNFVGLTNKILNDDSIPYRIHKGVNTLADGGKQMYSLPYNMDIRENREFQAAAEYAEDWLTDELSGYWKWEDSDESLNKDLFMRISRKASEIRVQRGCLEKELNYGIAKIKEILEGL